MYPPSKNKNKEKIKNPGLAKKAPIQSSWYLYINKSSYNVSVNSDTITNGMNYENE